MNILKISNNFSVPKNIYLKNLGNGLKNQKTCERNMFYLQEKADNDSISFGSIQKNKSVKKIKNETKFEFKDEEDFWNKILDLKIQNEFGLVPTDIFISYEDIDKLAKKNKFGIYSSKQPNPKLPFDGNIFVKTCLKHFVTNRPDEVGAHWRVFHNFAKHWGPYSFHYDCFLTDFRDDTLRNIIKSKRDFEGMSCNYGLKILPEKKDDRFVNYTTESEDDYYVSWQLFKNRCDIEPINSKERKTPLIISQKAIDEACQDLRTLAKYGFELTNANSFCLTKEGTLYLPHTYSILCHNPNILENYRRSEYPDAYCLTKEGSIYRPNSNYSFNGDYDFNHDEEEDEFMKNRHNKEFLDKYINSIKEKIKNCKNVIIK